ncbi:hypothetical protein C8R47DRAFT_501309 [Mycena vitilis]|nr:hypothetical protein C8R47DRAFT_501309 [Mycena vitilis]
MRNDHDICSLGRGFASSARRSGRPLLEIAAIILIGIGILPALFSGRVSRTATWYSFMLSWMWYFIANVILAGRRTSTEPPFSLCLFQSGLIYASPVFTCATGLAFRSSVHN